MHHGQFRLIMFFSFKFYLFKGEINIDQSALAGVLGSNQKSARVTFVRVGEEGVVVENQVLITIQSNKCSC